MDIVDVAVFAAGVLIVLATWMAVERARAGRISHRFLERVAVGCLVLLALVTLSDWPTEWLSAFWSEHSIVGALVSTLLLVGAGLIGIEARNLHEEARLSEAMAGTASIRRLVGGARDWASLASGSLDGRAVLAMLGRVRNELTGLQAAIETGDPKAIDLWASVRADLQHTIVALEMSSGTPVARREVAILPTADIRPLIGPRWDVIDATCGAIGANRSKVGEVRGFLPSLVVLTARHPSFERLAADGDVRHQREGP